MGNMGAPSTSPVSSMDYNMGMPSSGLSNTSSMKPMNLNGSMSDGSPSSQEIGGIWKAFSAIICIFFLTMGVLGFFGSNEHKYVDKDGQVQISKDSNTAKYTMMGAFMLFVIGLLLFIINNYNRAFKDNNLLAVQTLSMWFGIIMSLFTAGVLFGYTEYRRKYPQLDISFIDYYSRFLFGDGDMRFSMTNFVKGLGFGLVFGFIDNFGLATGMEALDSYVPTTFVKPVDVKDAYGNTFSDFIGSFIGTFFVSLVLGRHTDTPAPPLASDVMGVTLGCVIGLFIAKAAKPAEGKKASSKNNMIKYFCAFGFLCMSPICAACYRYMDEKNKVVVKVKDEINASTSINAST